MGWEWWLDLVEATKAEGEMVLLAGVGLVGGFVMLVFYLLGEEWDE